MGTSTFRTSTESTPNGYGGSTRLTAGDLDFQDINSDLTIQTFSSLTQTVQTFSTNDPTLVLTESTPNGYGGSIRLAVGDLDF